MARKKINSGKTIRTQVSLDSSLEDMVELLTLYPTIHGATKNDVIVGILREYHRDRFQKAMRKEMMTEEFKTKARKQKETGKV